MSSPPTTSSIPITTFLSYLKSGKDIRKDGKLLYKLLSEILQEKEQAPYLVDPLLSEVLVRLEGNSQIERECVILIYALCYKSFLPQNLRPQILKPMFLHEKLSGATNDKPLDPASENWMKNLEQEILKSEFDVYRRSAALRLAGALCQTGKVSSSSKRKLAETCQNLIVAETMLLKISAPNEPKTPPVASSRILQVQKSFTRKNSASSTLTGLTKEAELNFVILSEACLSAAEKALPESSSILSSEIAVALGANRGEISRLAMKYYLTATIHDIEAVNREFSMRLPASLTSFDLSDTLAARDYARILFSLISSPKDKTFHALTLLIRDERFSVSLLASSLLALLPWNWLNSHVLPVDSQKAGGEQQQQTPSSSSSRRLGGGSKLIPEIAYRMTQALLCKRSTILLSACETLAILGRARNDWIAEDVANRRSQPDPFFPLSSKVTSLCLDSPNHSICAQAAVALAWIGKPSSGLADKLKAVKNIGTDCSLVVEALVERSKKNPHRENVECLLAVMWHFRNDIRSDLGEKGFAACLLSSKRDENRGSGKYQQGLTLKYALSFLDWANDLQVTHWENSILALFACDWYFPSTNERRIFNSVLVRVERSFRFSSHWSVRREAASALVKLGVVVGEPIRIEVFQILLDFFQASRKQSFERDQDIRNEIVAPALQLFDDVYALLSRNETDPVAFEVLNKTAGVLCSGLPINFSFCTQTKEFLQRKSTPTSSQVDDEEKEDHSDDDDDDDERDSASSSPEML